MPRIIKTPPIKMSLLKSGPSHSYPIRCIGVVTDVTLGRDHYLVSKTVRTIISIWILWPSLSPEFINLSLSPSSISACYGARHFSNQSRYSSEQNKNPCSHRTSFLMYFLFTFSQNPKSCDHTTYRGWILGNFHQG